jgi:hypothetical protein
MQRRLCPSYTFCHARLKSCDIPALLRVTRYFLFFSPFYPVFLHSPYLLLLTRQVECQNVLILSHIPKSNVRYALKLENADVLKNMGLFTNG